MLPLHNRQPALWSLRAHGTWWLVDAQSAPTYSVELTQDHHLCPMSQTGFASICNECWNVPARTQTDR